MAQKSGLEAVNRRNWSVKIFFASSSVRANIDSDKLIKMDRGLKVWVIYGGSSSEREVSLKTGRGVSQALGERAFDVTPIEFDGKAESLLSLPWLEAGPDIVFIGLHGSQGEDGALQGFLQSLDIKFVGSAVLASSLCFHKGATKNVLAQHGVPVPSSHDFSSQKDFEEFISSQANAEKLVKGAWFFKPAEEGSTIGIERYKFSGQSPEQGLAEIKQKFETAMGFGSDVLVEEWVEGPELTTPVFGGRAKASIEIRPKSQFYDYKSKYTAGETEFICPAPLTPELTTEVAQVAEKAYSVLKCEDYARVDFILGENGPVVLEVNTLPGMTETSLVPKSMAAEGVSYGEFLEQLVLASFKRQAGEKRK